MNSEGPEVFSEPRRPSMRTELPNSLWEESSHASYWLDSNFNSGTGSGDATLPKQFVRTPDKSAPSHGSTFGAVPSTNVPQSETTVNDWNFEENWNVGEFERLDPSTTNTSYYGIDPARAENSIPNRGPTWPLEQNIPTADVGSSSMSSHFSSHSRGRDSESLESQMMEGRQRENGPTMAKSGIGIPFLSPDVLEAKQAENDRPQSSSMNPNSDEHFHLFQSGRSNSDTFREDPLSFNILNGSRNQPGLQDTSYEIGTAHAHEHVSPRMKPDRASDDSRYQTSRSLSSQWTDEGMPVAARNMTYRKTTDLSARPAPESVSVPPKTIYNDTVGGNIDNQQIAQYPYSDMGHGFHQYEFSGYNVIEGPLSEKSQFEGETRSTGLYEHDSWSLGESVSESISERSKPSVQTYSGNLSSKLPFSDDARLQDHWDRLDTSQQSYDDLQPSKPFHELPRSQQLYEPSSGSGCSGLEHTSVHTQTDPFNTASNRYYKGVQSTAATLNVGTQMEPDLYSAIPTTQPTTRPEYPKSHPKIHYPAYWSETHAESIDEEGSKGEKSTFPDRKPVKPEHSLHLGTRALGPLAQGSSEYPPKFGPNAQNSARQTNNPFIVEARGVSSPHSYSSGSLPSYAHHPQDDDQSPLHSRRPDMTLDTNLPNSDSYVKEDRFSSIPETQIHQPPLTRLSHLPDGYSDLRPQVDHSGHPTAPNRIRPDQQPHESFDTLSVSSHRSHHEERGPEFFSPPHPNIPWSSEAVDNSTSESGSYYYQHISHSPQPMQNAPQCPRCGKSNDPDANFCSRCANPLHTSSKETEQYHTRSQQKGQTPSMPAKDMPRSSENMSLHMERNVDIQRKPTSGSLSSHGPSLVVSD